MLEDKILLWRFKRGSTDALERIYEKHKGYLTSVATALLNDTHAAEDCLHDFFVSLVNAADSIRLNRSFKAYSAVCVANIAKNKLKRRKLEPATLEGNCAVEAQYPEPVLLTQHQEQTVMINNALSQLPFEQREVITLHLLAGMTFAQIAKSSGTSINTIQSRYRYGIDKLKTLLNSEVIK